MRKLRLSHPALDFWIDVRVGDFNRCWLAVADLAGTPEIGVGATPRSALMGALKPFDHAVRTGLVSRAIKALAWA